MSCGSSFHLIYKVTCKTNGKYYIGAHSTSNLDDGYFGSGLIVKSSIKKYGVHNHKIEFLEFCSNRKDLLIREAQIVNEQLLKDPLCMNLKTGGAGFDSIVAIKAQKSLATKLLDPEYKRLFGEKVRNGLKGKKKSKEHIEKVANTHRGRKRSLETRLKMSLAKKGKKFTEEHKLAISLAKSKKIDI